MNPIKLLIVALVATSLCSCATRQDTASNGLWHPSVERPAPGPTPIGPPIVKPDKVVVDTEIALLSARDTFNFYVHLENDNRAYLAKVDSHFHEFANYLKIHAIGWLSKAETLKELYKKSSTLFNLNALEKQMTSISNEVYKTKDITKKATSTP